MEAALIQKKLVVKKSPIHGYGVFADQDFEPGEIIEECRTLICETVIPELNDYLFWIENTNGLPLGFGCLYNHADDCSADYAYDAERSVIVIRAEKRIKRGEEIFVYYGEDWFRSRQLIPKIISAQHKLLSALIVFTRFTIVAGALFGMILLLK